jgi:hypothetical protein
VLDLDRVDLGEIASALQDQGGYEHRWLVNPDTGEIAFWTEDTGIDGRNPVDLDDLGLIAIDPLPSYVWYQDMADFAEGISDEQAGRRLARAIDGRGAFRHFKAELHEEYRICCLRGTPSGTPVPCAAPWNGLPSTVSSTMKPPADTSPITRNHNCPDATAPVRPP